MTEECTKRAWASAEMCRRTTRGRHSCSSHHSTNAGSGTSRPESEFLSICYYDGRGRGAMGSGRNWGLSTGMGCSQSECGVDECPSNISEMLVRAERTRGGPRGITPPDVGTFILVLNGRHNSNVIKRHSCKP